MYPILLELLEADCPGQCALLVLYQKRDQLCSNLMHPNFSSWTPLLGPPGSPKLSSSSDIVASRQRVRSAGRDPWKGRRVPVQASLSGPKIVGGKLQMANEPRVLAPAGYETPEFQSRDRAGIGGDAGGAQSIHSCAV